MVRANHPRKVCLPVSRSGLHPKTAKAKADSLELRESDPSV